MIHWLACVIFSFALTAIVSAHEVTTILGTGRDGFAGDGGPAAKAECGGPFGLVVGPDGALYVCETTSHTIRRVDLQSGVATTVVGTPGKAGHAGDGEVATKALCREPYEVRFDRDGHMLFVDMKADAVRRVDAQTGIITTVAGGNGGGFRGDGGPATKAQMKEPHSITLDDRGGLYLCDIKNHRVRRVDLASGVIETFAGTGRQGPTPDGAPLVGTPLNGPRALEVEPSGNLLLALREGNALYRIDLAKGTLSHLAGTGKSGYSGHGGPAREAKLSGPKGVARALNGDIYLADTESHTIRVVRQATGMIETVIGDGQAGDGPDGDPLKCRLNRPHGVFVDAAGNIYVGDSSNHKVRVLRVD